MRNYFSSICKFNQCLNNARVIARKACAYFLSVTITLSTSVNSFANISPIGGTNIDKSANNIPVVNIVDPNSAGVSHNKFTDFNVDSKGVILNNSMVDSRSQPGGRVFSNSNLKSEANLIINEVVSGNRSNIFGSTEIVGKSADYILANPNGIRINGAEFINMNNVTLTTGNIMLGDKGELSKIVVDQGLIEIFDRDINVRDLGYFDIISKTVMISQKIHADNNVRIIAGKNTYDYNKKEVISSKDSQDNYVAIDSKALGGLYAGKISIISTEKGCGVNLPELESRVDEIEITVDGKIVHKKIKSAKGFNIKSQSDGVRVEAGKGIVSSGDINISAHKDIEIATGGNIEASRSLTLNSSKGTITNQGTLQSKGSQGMEIIAAEFINEGQVNTDKGSLQIVADKATNRKTIVSGSRLVANIKNDFDNYGGLKSTDNMELTVNGTLSNYSRAVINTPDSLMIRAGRLINHKDAIIKSSATTNITPDSYLSNSGLIQGKYISISNAQNGLNNVGKIISTDNNLEITLSGELVNSGDIHSEQFLNIDSTGKIENTGEIISKHGMQIKSENDLVNKGNIKAVNTISLLVENDLNNSGTINSDKKISAQLKKQITNSGTIKAENISINSENAGFDNVQGGHLDAKVNIDISVLGKLSNSGVVTAINLVDMKSTNSLIYNTGSIISTSNDVIINADKKITNLGVISANNIRINSVNDGVYNLKDGKVDAGQNLNIIAAELLSNSGVITSKNLVKLTSHNNNIENTNKISAKVLDITKANEIINQGLLEATNTIEIGKGRVIDLTNKGEIISQNDLSFNLVGKLENTKLIKAKDIKIYAGKDIINRSQISSDNDAQIAATGNITNLGKIRSDHNLSIVAGNNINNEGRLQSKYVIDLESLGGNLFNTKDAVIIAPEKLKITANIIDNAGSLSTVSDSSLIDLTARADIHNSGEIISGNDISVSTKGRFDNKLGGLLESGGKITLDIGNGLSNSGKILADKKLSITVKAGDLLNYGDIVSELDGIKITADNGDITNNNLIKATHKINIDAWHGDITNNALIEADGDIAINAHEGSYTQNSKVDNHGILSQNGDIIIKANKDISINDGTIESGNIINLTAKGLIENNGGNVTSEYSIELSGDNGIVNAGQISSKNISITSDDFFENKGLVSSTGALTINNKGTLTNKGVLQSKGRLEINSEGKLINHNVIYTKDSLIITTQSDIINLPISSLTADNDLTINALQGKVVNHGAISAISGVADIKTKNGYFAKGGYLWGGEKLDIKADQGSIEAEDGSKILTAGQLSIKADSIKINQSLLEAAIANIEALKGDFTSDSSRLIVTDKIHITANNIDANSIISAGNKIHLGAKSTAKFGSKSELKSTNELTITAGDNIENNGHIQFNSGSLISSNGQIINNGNILSANSFNLTSAKGISVTNSGVINAKDLHLNVNGRLINHGDINISGKLNVIKAPQIQNYKNITFGTLTSDNGYKLPEYKGESGSVLEGGNLNLRIGSVKFREGTMKINDSLNTQFDSAELGTLEIKGGKSELKISGTLNNSKNLTFDGSSFELDVSSLANSGVIKGDNLTIKVAGNATNSGSIFGRKNLSITAPTISNNSGFITSSGTLTLNASSSLNNTGSIVSTGDGTITAGSIYNSNKINSLGNLSLYGAVTNTSELAGRSSLSIDGSLTNSGRIVSGDNDHTGSITISKAGNFTNNGIITSYGSVSISALSLTNKNTIEARNDLTISVDGDLINEQSIYAGSMDISANNITNNNRIISVNGMELYATNDVVNKNIIQLLSSGTITIEANNIINKREGVQVKELNAHDLKQYLSKFTDQFDSLDAGTFTFEYEKNKYRYKKSGENPLEEGNLKQFHVYQDISKYYDFFEEFTKKGSPAPTIIANGSIKLNAKNNINNKGAKISATKDITVDGSNLENEDITLKQYDFRFLKQLRHSGREEKKEARGIKGAWAKVTRYHRDEQDPAFQLEYISTHDSSNPDHKIDSIIEAGGEITGSLADQVTNGSEHSGGNKKINNGSGSSAASLSASAISSPSEPHTPKVAGTISEVIMPKLVEKPSEKAPAPPEEQKPKDSTMSLGPVGLAIKYKKNSKIGKNKMDDSDINMLVQDIESKYKDNRAPPVIPSTQSITSASEYQLPENINQDIEVKQVLESANWSSPPPPGRYYIKETSHVFTELSSYFSTEHFAERTNGTYNPKHHNIPQSQQAVHLGDSIKQAEFVLRQHQNMTGLSTIIDGMDYMDQMRTVFERGMEFTKAHKLTPQVEITPELAAQIHEDMVLAQEIEVRGTKVIIPRLYLGDSKRGVQARGLLARDIDLSTGGITNDSDIIGSRISLQTGSGGITNTGDGLIQGDQHLHLSTSGDLTNVGAKIRSSGTSNIIAQNIYNITEKSTKSSGATTWQETGSTAEISSVSDMLIKAKGDVTSVGAKMLADHLGLNVGGDMYSGSIALDSSSESSSGNTQTKTQSRVYIPTTIQTSKGTTAFVAGDFTMVGSSMRSKGSNKLDIGGNLHVESQIAGDYSQSSASSTKRRGLLKGKESKTTMSSTAKEHVHVSQIEAGGENVITTAGDQQYIGAEIKSSGGTRISARQAKLKALMTEDSTSTVSSYRNRVIQKQRAHGHATSTANTTQISGDVEFDTQNGINIEYGSAAGGRGKKSAGKESADLAARPEWMSKLDGNGQVSFSAVTQQNDSWNQKKQSLTPEAATVVSAGVALGTFALTGGLSSLASGSVLAAAESSAVTAFSATRANQVINAAVSNRGNVVGTVKDSYNSKAFGKALKAGAQAGAISGITAGVTQATGLGSMTNQVGGVEVAKSGVGRYVALGQRGLVQGAATSVVTGEKLNKSLEQSMGSAALAIGQTAVGDIAASSGMADGSVTKIGMHAAVGGVYSVANGGKFATGALGGAAGEVLGSNIDANDKAGGAKVQFATTVGGFLAGANAKDMQMAANVAASSFEHNRRMHPKELQYLNELKAGKSEEERLEYDAAAFALIKADKGVPTSDRYSSYIKSQVREGSRYEAKQQELKAYAQSKGDYDAFEYGWMDRMSDFAARNSEIGVRARGGVKVGVGASGAIVSAGVGSATAPAGGAFFGAAGATASTMYAVSGYKEAFGAYNSTEGVDVLRSAQTPTNSFAYDAHTNIGLAASEAVLSGIAAQKLGGVALDAASKGKALAKGGLQKAKDVLKQGADSPAPAAASHVTTATSPASKVTVKPAATTVASSSAATKPAATSSVPTTPMTSANGNNSPNTAVNNTTVKSNTNTDTQTHKNSLDYQGETHVYSIKNVHTNEYNKIGESAQGTRKKDGASKRAEQQARELRKKTGEDHITEIRKTFPDKKQAREYETKLIERFRSLFGKDKLTGNKTNR